MLYVHCTVQLLRYVKIKIKNLYNTFPLKKNVSKTLKIDEQSISNDKKRVFMKDKKTTNFMTFTR